MAKSLKDIVKGVKSSKTDAGKLGKDPGVDYEPKAGDEQKFVGKHSVEKHADRVGNGDDIYNATNVKHSLDDKAKEPRHGHRKGEDKKVYEGTKCNSTPKGTHCPKHGLNECSSMVKEEEQAEGYIHIGPADGSSPYDRFGNKRAGTTTLGKEKPVYKSKQQRDSESAKKFAAIRSNTQKEEVNLDEALGDHAGLAKYADEHGRIDKDDLHTAAKHIKSGNMKALDKHLHAMDTDPRDKALEYVNKKHYEKLGYRSEEVEQVDELSKKTLGSYVNKAVANKGMNDRYSAGKPAGDKESDKMATQRAAGIKIAVKKLAKEEVIDEVLTKSTTAGETISDFVHSKNHKFAGKSKEERKRMALGAYYAKQNEETEIVEVNHRDYAAKGKMHPDVAKNMKVGQYADFYSHGTGNKQYGMVTKNTGTAVYIKADKKTHKFSVTPHLGEDYAVEPLLGGMKPSGSSDEAVEMVKSELKALANKAIHLVSQMPNSMHVEPWVQAKIAQAKSYVSDVHDYCIYGDHDKPEEDEQMDTPIQYPGLGNSLGANV